MNSLKSKTYEDKVKIKIKFLWAALFIMLAYMVAVGEMGLGDSRIMMPLAQRTSKIIFFGTIIYIALQIAENKKYLKNKKLLIKSEILKQDERRLLIYDKSGGLAADILLCAILFIACTAAIINMAAFYTAFIILFIAITIKTACYLYYNKRY